MKPGYIEFVEDRRWRWVWATAAVCAGLLVWGVFWWLGPVRQAHVETSERLVALHQKLQASRVPLPSKPNPRQASLALSAQLLQQDFNQIFAAAENLQEPGVRLRSLNLDAGAMTLRLEYELDSLKKASTVTALLNTGHDQKPWQLQSVVRNGATGSTLNSLPTDTTKSLLPATSQFRGIWSVPLKQL